MRRRLQTRCPVETFLHGDNVHQLLRTEAFHGLAERYCGRFTAVCTGHDNRRPLGIVSGPYNDGLRPFPVGQRHGPYQCGPLITPFNHELKDVLRFNDSFEFSILHVPRKGNNFEDPYARPHEGAGRSQYRSDADEIS